jgi:putative endonuclease
MATTTKPWFVYLIECTDRSIYTGIAVDVAARFAAHRAGKGARYTRSHPPLRLLASIEYPDRSAAARAEYRVKRLSAAAKRELAREHAVEDRDDRPARVA